MNPQSRLKAVLAPLAVLLYLALVTLQMEGAGGLAVFLNLEALLLVAGGAFMAVWSAYSLREMTSMSDPAMLSFAADCSLGMGVLGTVFGFILMLAGVSDVTMLPRRMALALTCLLFGLVLSEAVFRPLARRAGRAAGQAGGPDAPPAAGSSRLMLAALGLGVAMSCLFAVLYALSASLNLHTRLP